MICPKCGSDIPDDLTCCPFCEHVMASLEKAPAIVSQKVYTQSHVKNKPRVPVFTFACVGALVLAVSATSFFLLNNSNNDNTSSDSLLPTYASYEPYVAASDSKNNIASVGNPDGSINIASALDSNLKKLDATLVSGIVTDLGMYSVTIPDDWKNDDSYHSPNNITHATFNEDSTYAQGASIFFSTFIEHYLNSGLKVTELCTLEGTNEAGYYLEMRYTNDTNIGFGMYVYPKDDVAHIIFIASKDMLSDSFTKEAAGLAASFKFN